VSGADQDGELSRKRKARSELDRAESDLGTAYRIRTGDLRLERAVS
jgi:hypothetical protein